MRKVALVAYLLLAGSVSALETVEEIESCVEANLPDHSSRQSVVIESIDRAGSSSESQVDILWKKFPNDLWRVLARFNEPARVRHTALLIAQKEERAEMHVYLPDLRMIRRITKRSFQSSMLGTDLTYEDFERAQGLAEEIEQRRLPDSVLDDFPVYVIEGRPERRDESMYSKVIEKIDHKTCVPLEVELYDENQRLIKLVSAKREKLSKEPSGWVARELVIEDLVKGSRTIMHVEKVELEPNLSDKLFTTTQLLIKSR